MYFAIKIGVRHLQGLTPGFYFAAHQIDMPVKADLRRLARHSHQFLTWLQVSCETKVPRDLKCRRVRTAIADRCAPRLTLTKSSLVDGRSSCGICPPATPWDGMDTFCSWVICATTILISWLISTGETAGPKQQGVLSQKNSIWKWCPACVVRLMW